MGHGGIYLQALRGNFVSFIHYYKPPWASISTEESQIEIFKEPLPSFEWCPLSPGLDTSTDSTKDVMGVFNGVFPSLKLVGRSYHWH